MAGEEFSEIVRLRQAAMSKNRTDKAAHLISNSGKRIGGRTVNVQLPNNIEPLF